MKRRCASGSRGTGPTWSASRRSRRNPSRSRSCSSSRPATGATGTARAATREWPCTCRKELCSGAARSSAHPEFDLETRIVTAEVGGRHDRLGLRAQRRQGLRGQAPLPRGARNLGRRRARRRARAAPLRRPERRADRPRRPPQGAEARRRRPARGRARADAPAPGAGPRPTSAARSTPTTTPSSPGGRPGATCASATSAGASTTSWRAKRWPKRRGTGWFGRRSGRATTRPSWRPSTARRPRAGARSWRGSAGFGSIRADHAFRRSKEGFLLQRRYVATLFAGGLLAGSAIAWTPPDDRIAQVENGLRPPVLIEGDKTWTLADRMRFYHVEGVSIAVIRDSKIEWAKGYGLADVEAKQSVTASTLFQAGSISKPVAAMGALALVEDGKLALDGDINRFLKGWKVPGNAHTAKAPVTLEGLLSHTAGLTVHGFPGYAAGEPVPTVPQVLDGAPPANTAPVRVDLDPGTQYRYSGGGYTIAQLAMTDVTGQPFPALMQKLVLGPLGMKESTYEQPLPAARVAGGRGGLPRRREAGPGQAPRLPGDGGGGALDDGLGPGALRDRPAEDARRREGPARQGDGAEHDHAAQGRLRARPRCRGEGPDPVLHARRRRRGIPGAARGQREPRLRSGGDDQLRRRLPADAGNPSRDRRGVLLGGVPDRAAGRGEAARPRSSPCTPAATGWTPTRFSS